MIELRDLQFQYAQSEFALRIKELSLAQGQQTCWIGPSGSGKTTLLHLVAGIYAPQTGRVKACDVELTALQEATRRDFRIANIGLVLQDFALLDYLSVLDNILLPYRISRALQMDASVRSRAEHLATDVGLRDLLPRRPTQLSQGEKQRVAVCRAIIADPKLLLADEPTANLDATNAARVLDALEQYSTDRDATLVVVSHDRDVMSRFASSTDVAEMCVQTPMNPAGDGHHG